MHTSQKPHPSKRTPKDIHHSTHTQQWSFFVEKWNGPQKNFFFKIMILFIKSIFYQIPTIIYLIEIYIQVKHSICPCFSFLQSGVRAVLALTFSWYSREKSKVDGILPSEHRTEALNRFSILSWISKGYVCLTAHRGVKHCVEHSECVMWSFRGASA